MANIQKISYIGILITLGLELQAQENKSITPKSLTDFNISGSIDTYFRTNLNGLNKYDGYNNNGEYTFEPQAPLTSFADDPGFSFGMANLILAYQGEKAGFVADLVFGPRGEDAVFASSPSSNIVNQMYAYWNVSETLKLTLGNFNTFLGYEVISPAANFNYSTSYMFSYGPFSHTGIKADLSIDYNWSVMMAVLNPTDWTEFNTIGKYSIGGQIGYSSQAGSTFLNLLYGEQTSFSDKATFQADLTTGWDLTESLFLGFNTTYNATDGEGFYGAALYPQVQTHTNFAIGLRAEYFKELENDGPVYGPDTQIINFTLTGNYYIGNLIIKPELRLDKVNHNPSPVFTNRHLRRTDNLSSFVMAAVYAF